MTEPKHIISFSGGRSSGMMLDLLLKQNPDTNFIVVFLNTSKETTETYNFIKKCITYFNIELIVLEWKQFGVTITNIDDCKKNGEIFEAVISYMKSRLPNVAQRWCTDRMKKTAFRRYMKLIGAKQYMSYIGIRYDEPQRYSKGIAHSTKNIYNDYPLYYNKIIKKDVNEFWAKMPFDLEHDSLFGNCDLCFLKGKAKKVKILRHRPETAKWWLDMEELVGHTFVKDYSVKDLVTLSQQPQFDFPEQEEKEIICSCLND